VKDAAGVESVRMLPSGRALKKSHGPNQIGQGGVSRDQPKIRLSDWGYLSSFHIGT